MAKITQTFKVTNYELKDAHILATIELDGTTVTKHINKDSFLNWIGNGLGQYPATVINGSDVFTVNCPLSQYWDETASVICEHLTGFIGANEYIKADVLSDLLSSKLLDSIYALPIPSEEKKAISELLLQFGEASRQWGGALANFLTNIPSPAKKEAA